MDQNNVKTILIQSILGGQARFSHFAQENQFRASLGIDPGQPLDDSNSSYSTVASGILRPVPTTKVSGTTLTSAPLWMKNNPKDQSLYVYDASSSVYTLNTSGTFSNLPDKGATSGTGNGMEYYDNYYYFATATDIARYGPLNGTPGWVPSYWTGTLSKAALTNTTYPATYKHGILLPNHVMCRHSDGRLYIADVVGNQGTLHYIKTTKTTVEGDTDNGSTVNALQFGYGLWPTAIESYDTSIAVGLIETLASSNNKRGMVAKFSLWDTTSSTFNQICWKEFPDQLITGIKNVDGTIFIASGNINAQGYRITRYLGGNSFKEEIYSETGEPPLAGALEAVGRRLLYGTYTTIPASNGCVYANALQNGQSGHFNIMAASNGNSSTVVTAVALFTNGAQTPVDMSFYTPTIGWTAGSGTHGIDQQQTTYGNSSWWSKTYTVGMPFKVLRVRLPLAQAVGANMTVAPKIYYDNGQASQTLTVINNTNFPNGETVANCYVDNTGGNEGRGENSFWLELAWSGTALCAVEFPIEIDIELIKD